MHPFIGFFPIKSLKKIEQNNIVLAGIPFEGSKDTKKGSKKFPAQLRNISYLFSGISPKYNFNRSSKRFVDVGDIHPKKNITAIKDLWEKVESTNSKLIILGGDHLTTYYSLSNAPIGTNTGIIWLDAHVDLAQEYPSRTFLSHATVLYNLIEEKFISPEQALIIGGHAFSHSEHEYNYIKSEDINIITTEQIFDNVEHAITRIDDFLAEHPSIYLSLDIDILDQSFVPTVSCPEPFGLYPHHLTKILSHIVPKTTYIDIVEGRITKKNTAVARIVCSLIFQIISLWDVSIE